MVKLYPPGLNGTLPAFSDLSEVKIPFIPNKAVANNEENIYGFSIIVKTINTNKVIGIATSTIFDFQEEWVQFNFNSLSYQNENDSAWKKLKRGQFYKIQIAYMSSESEVGYYSTVGVIKYTGEPVLSITNLELGDQNSPQLRYIGKYVNTEDSTEKVYSYQFTIYDDKGEVFDTSGEKIHNHSSDVIDSLDEYTCNKELELNKLYFIIYSITTVNGLVAMSHQYTLQNLETEPMTTDLFLSVYLNEENAYVSVNLESRELATDGNFVITRACSKDNYAHWYEIHRIHIEDTSAVIGTEILKDFTVEHGYTYKYGIQQYNKYGYYTNKRITEGLPVKFEHLYFYDGDKQLKIKFNPKISNFKQTLQETKTNTMGSKYPYIFRNGFVGYKEFTVTGLLSYHSDEEELFMSEAELFSENFQISDEDAYKDRYTYSYDSNTITGYRNTALTDSNIKAEKKYRDQVLEFLNNGKPKIFKSPTEGNYIVYTMNNTLTPNDTVGRMLYTFSTAISEIAEYNYQNLIGYNLLSPSSPAFGRWFWKTLPTHYLYDLVIENGGEIKKENQLLNKYFKITYGYDIYAVHITDAEPGTIYYIDGQEIRIGISGEYQIEFNRKISNLGVIPSPRSGWVTIRYKRETFNEFNKQKQIIINKIPVIQQFVGKRHIMEELDNSWEELSSITYFKFTKRPMITLYTNYENLATDKNGDRHFKEGYEKYYTDKKCSIVFSEDDFTSDYIYQIISVKTDKDIVEKIKGNNNSIISNPILQKKYKKLLGDLEECEFYIDVAPYDIKYEDSSEDKKYKAIKTLKSFPRKSYLYKNVEYEDRYIEDAEYKVKSEFQADWLNVKINRENYNNKYHNNPIYNLIMKKEIIQQEYVKELGLINYVPGVYYYYDELEEKFILDSGDFDPNKIYYSKGIKENDLVFMDAKPYSEYYIKADEKKVFISPKQFDFKVRIDIENTIQDDDIVTTQTKRETSILDIENNLILDANNFKDIKRLDIGWGVTCEIVYNSRKREYGFNGWSEAKGKKNLSALVDVEDYVKFVNWVTDQIYFYREGDN